MTPPKQTILFGTEIEFALATNHSQPRVSLPTYTSSTTSPSTSTTTPPSPSEKRIHFLTPTTIQQIRTQQAHTKGNYNYVSRLTLAAAQQDIIASLAQLGIDCVAVRPGENPSSFSSSSSSSADPKPWSLTTDISVSHLESGANWYRDGDDTAEFSDDSSNSDIDIPDEHITWHGMELRTSPLAFTVANLALVGAACGMLQSRYRVLTNTTTGLHVHVSGGLDEILQLSTLKKLFAFLWAFEPQIASLHPAHRQVESEFAKSLRVASQLSDECYDAYGILPSPAVAVGEIIAAEDVGALFELVRAPGSSRDVAYNVSPAVVFLKPKAMFLPSMEGARIPTVEFRQHAGTLDPGAVVAWIGFVGGLVEWCQGSEMSAVLDLLREGMAVERWFKRGKSFDGESERWYGAIPAEDHFTIIDLLKRIGLNDVAAFYGGKTYPVEAKPIRWQMAGATLEWEYMVMKAKLEISDLEYEVLHARRRAWEELQKVLMASAKVPNAPEVDFDPNHPMWPAHSWEEVGYFLGQGQVREKVAEGKPTGFPV